MMQKISKTELAARLEARVECAEGGMEGLNSQVPACLGGARLAVPGRGDRPQRLCRLRPHVKLIAMRFAKGNSCSSRGFLVILHSLTLRLVTTRDSVAQWKLALPLLPSP